MNSITAWLLESEATKDYTAYRLPFDVKAPGWLTGIRNMTLGTLWFPRFGLAAYDVNDAATVVKLDSFKSLSPADIASVYGSPIPALPVDLLALSNYVNPHSFDDGTDTDPDEPGDVSNGAVPPDLPYMQVEVDYLLAQPVDFDVQIQAAGSTPWTRDECQHQFLLVPATITLTALVTNVHADGVVSATTWKWHVTGGQLVAGTPDVASNDPSITIAANAPGTVSVSVEAVVTTTVGQGVQVVTEPGTRSAAFHFEVLTLSEAAMVERICKLLQETLPIPRRVFPGDPAKLRVGPEYRQFLTSAASRIGRASEALIGELNRLAGEVGRDAGQRVHPA